MPNEETWWKITLLEPYMTFTFKKQKIHNYIILNCNCTAKNTTGQWTDIFFASYQRDESHGKINNNYKLVCYIFMLLS